MLRLTDQTATISSINIRNEMHGDDLVPSCDIGIKFDSGAKILDSFDKGLRDAFYSDDKANSPQTRVPGTGAEQQEGPTLKFNGTLGSFKIKKEWGGYKAGIEWGDIASSVDMELAGIKVCKISAEPKDGGTCGITLQMQCHPTKDQYGELAMINGREITLSLTPPTAAELKKIEKEAAKKKENEDPED